ncbi:MAG: beta-phosphoglucomutase [Bacteroidota bacterium]
MIKAAIFDLDGVIVDTARYHYLAWKRLASELGIDLTVEQNELLKGVSRMRSLEIILDLGGIKVSDHEKDRLADKKNGWFVEFINTIKPEEMFPGVKELLNGIRSKGLKVALASSSKNAATVIKLLNIQNEFDVIVDGTMTTRSKPDPEIFLLAASKLGVAPRHCVVFEDAEAGVVAAIAAGMKCIGIGTMSKLGKANLVIKKTGDFKLETLITEF